MGWVAIYVAVSVVVFIGWCAFLYRRMSKDKRWVRNIEEDVLVFTMIPLCVAMAWPISFVAGFGYACVFFTMKCAKKKQEQEV